MHTTRTSMEGLTILLFSSTLFSMLITDSALDTITATQSIRDNETIVSAGGTFELGFFSPGRNKNRYLGIWYKKISIKTVVWVANREIPLTDSSGVLKITDQGILTLLNSTDDVIWCSDSSRPVQNPVAQLLELGNLVVRDGNDDNQENFMWQSFDHPCDTLLPDMKLGRNIITGLDRYLTCWKNTDDPSQGDYTVRVDPHGFPQVILSKGSVVQSRSGPWTGPSFSGTPGLKSNPLYTFVFVFNEKEMYYKYELTNSSVVSRMVLIPSGTLQRFMWIDRTQDWNLYVSGQTDSCDRYALCGPYGSCNINNSPVCGCLRGFVPKFPNDWGTADWSNGCVRKTPLDCKNGEGFNKYSGLKLPDTQHSWFNQSMNLEDCAILCLKNCSCTAYANSDIRGGGSGCLLWFGDLIDIIEFNEYGQDVYIRMAASELDDNLKINANSNEQKRVRILVSSLSIGMLLLGLALVLYIWKKKQRKDGNMGRNSKRDYINHENEKEDLELPLFDLASVTNATSNFSINNILGEGGFGPVYKGVLKEGQEIAVKRLSKDSTQGLNEFKNEVVYVAKLQHRNLVKLLGCCIEEDEMMLIYEFMPNKSLDSFIFDKTRSMLLDWPKRFHIISGIARGLLYLHQDSRLRIIHRDLKASNVLLDSEMNPKISDFGLARSFGGNEIKANTKKVVGTYGYMSPEYAIDGFYSVKSDVFSFGVLVLEIVSGKRNRGFYHLDHNLNLLGHAWRLHREGRFLEVIDASIRDTLNILEALRSVHIGLLCVQQCPEDRPSMSSVVLMLGSEGVLPPPKLPGFYTERNLPEAVTSSSKHEQCSVNENTITLLEAR